MKKLLILLVLGFLIYIGYLYFVKHENFTGIFREKNKQTEKTVTPAPLLLKLDLGKFAAIKSNKIPSGEIRLLDVDEAAQSCKILAYKSPGIVTKEMDLRKIIDKWTLEIKLLNVRNKTAALEIVNITDPGDQITLAGTPGINKFVSAGISSSRELRLTVRYSRARALKCRTLSYGYVRIDNVDQLKKECTITIYNVKAKLSNNVDFEKSIGGETVTARLISLGQNSAEIALSLSGLSDMFEVVN